MLGGDEEAVKLAEIEKPREHSHQYLGILVFHGFLQPWNLETYDARHLVTATLDSGQIGGGIFFFLQYPGGPPQAIFFDLKDVFTRFLHNFEVYTSGNYYMLHFHWDFIFFILFPGRGGWNNLRSVVASSGNRTYRESIIYAIFGQYYVSWPNRVHTLPQF